MYNGKFFYASPSGKLVRLDLQKGDVKDFEVPLLGDQKLYKGRYNLLDLNVDDNGLWIIYGLKDSNNTVVAKVRHAPARRPAPHTPHMPEARSLDLDAIRGILLLEKNKPLPSPTSSSGASRGRRRCLASGVRSWNNLSLLLSSCSQATSAST